MSQHLPIESLAVECKKIIETATKDIGEKHIKGHELDLVADNIDYADLTDLAKALVSLGYQQYNNIRFL